MIELQNRVQKQFQNLMDSRQREMERWPAVQGLSNDQGSADVSGMSGWVWVRIGNDESVARAFNNKTSHRNGLTVWVGKLPEQPTLFQVTDERQPYFNESAGGGAIGPHAAQHVWPSEDPTFVRYRQFADCRVGITNPASLSVEIADGYYFIEDELFYFAGSTQDLTAYVPVAGRVWVLLEMKPAGLNISSHATSSFALDTIPKVTDKSYWRTAAVALRPAQTAVTDYPNDQHIFDLRQSKIAGSESDPSAPAKNGWNPGVETEVAMSWDDVTRTLQLSPVGSTFEFWTEGIKRTKSSNDSVQITDTEGWWYIYYDGDTLTASQVAWVITDEDKAFVAYLYWDATNNEAVFGSPGWELHSWVMDAATHAWAHETIGTRYEDGLTISENPANQLEVTAGEIHDEDIMVDITDGAGAGLWEQDLSPLQAYKLYKLGAGGDWRQGGAFGVVPCILDGGNDVQWNQFVAGAWQLTAAGVNQYCAYWVLATPTHDEPIVIFVGQGAPAANIDTARDNNDISGMDFTNAGPEFKVLFRVMVRNIPGGVFYEVSALDDFRAATLLPSTGFVASAHGALSELGPPADDHLQYALLAGRAGGQTLIGGIAASEDLTLESTAHATKGFIIASDDIRLRTFVDLVGASQVAHFRNTNANERTILRVMPRGTEANIPAALEFFGTDFVADAVNFERLVIFAKGAGNTYYQIRTDAGGTGTLRPLQVTTGGNAGIIIDTSGNVGVQVVPSTRFDIGAGAIEFDEMAAPGGGAANTVRLFARDNGGVTELCAQFSDNDIVVIAADP